MTEGRATEMLEGFAAAGLGGVFVHPRMGLVTEYLSDRWFALWHHSVVECRRLGLECHIYDENSFPSGFGGGHVPAANPLVQGRALVAVPASSAPSPGATRLAVAWPTASGSWETDAQQHRRGTPLPQGAVAFDLQRWPDSLWNGGFTYVDLQRPEATREFLRTTHDRYAAELGEAFGSVIKYAFADEPSTHSGSGLTASRHLLAEFRNEHGYDLIPRLGALLGDEPAGRACRFDLWKTVQRLFTEGYLRPTHDWCAAHRLAFTGHFNEHEWPLPFSTPSAMAAQRWMQAPGIDMLGFQFRPTTLAENALYWMTLLEVGSVARQLGRERVLCETYGGGGYAYAPRDMKMLSDFVLAGGVNLVNPHLSYESLAGSRKMDWPQTISDHAPWWPAYGEQTAHDARVAWALTRGRVRNRVLVLHPTTTAWMHARPRSFLEAAGLPPPGDRRSTTPVLQELRERTTTTYARLTADWVDFDLGDELMLAELGSVDGRSLRIGEGAYELVVIPPGTDNLLESTVTLLDRFAAAGGRIVAATLPMHCNGRPADHGTWTRSAERVGDDDILSETVRSAVPPRLSAAGGATCPGGVLAHRRELDDGGIVVFLANPWGATVDQDIDIEGGAVLALDTATGEAVAQASRSLGKLQRVRLHLAPGAHALWYLSPNRSGSASAAAPAAREALPVRFSSAQRLQTNVLPLDYCSVRTPVGAYGPRHAANANLDVWRDNGFDQPLWEWSVQYRRSFVDAAVPAGAWAEVVYAFDVDPALPAADCRDCRIAIELPKAWRGSLNGAPLSEPGTRWLDEAIAAYPAAGSLRGGRNRLVLRSDPFSTRSEVSPAYLLGEFGLQPDASSFRVVPATPIGLGTWAENGMPFYPFEVAYVFTVEVRRPGRISVAIPDLPGSVARITIAGHSGWLVRNPFEWCSSGPVPEGSHELRVVLYGHLSNLLGPHLAEGLPGPWTWRQSPDGGAPGSAYRFNPTGLTGLPEVNLLIDTGSSRQP